MIALDEFVGDRVRERLDLHRDVIRADRSAVVPDDVVVDVDVAARDHERIERRVDHAGRLGVGLVDSAERDSRQRALLVVRPPFRGAFEQESLHDRVRFEEDLDDGARHRIRRKFLRFDE